MWPDETHKAAERLRELAHDRVASPYLVGVLLERTEPDEWADLVEAALVYRERFGASGNDRRQTRTEVVATGEHHCGHCAYCQWPTLDGKCCMSDRP